MNFLQWLIMAQLPALKGVKEQVIGGMSPFEDIHPRN